MIYFNQMELGPMANWVYLLGDSETGKCAVVDPAWDVDKILEMAASAKLSISDILLTHAHPDHVNGVAELVQKSSARVHIHEAEVDWLAEKSLPIVPSVDGTQLRIGALTISFLHTPGHSPGSQCFLAAGRLISGDTLFIDACGRTDLPGGNVEELHQSLTRLRGLDDSLWLSPGHDYSGRKKVTLGGQKRENVFLRTASLSEFVRFFQSSIY